MACTAYAVVGRDVNVRMKIEALDKLAIVARRVITHKAVEFRSDRISIECGAYDRALGSSSMVSVQVFEGDQYISLLESSICSIVRIFGVAIVLTR